MDGWVLWKRRMHVHHVDECKIIDVLSGCVDEVMLVVVLIFVVGSEGYNRRKHTG